MEATTPFVPNALMNCASRTPGSPKLPSATIWPIGLVACSAGPQECSTWGQSSPPVAPPPVPGSHSTAYGVGGAMIPPTRIWLAQSALSALMSDTNLLTSVSALDPVSLSWQSVRVSVGAAAVPWASGGGTSGGCSNAVGFGPVGSWHR